MIRSALDCAKTWCRADQCTPHTAWWIHKVWLLDVEPDGTIMVVADILIRARR